MQNKHVGAFFYWVIALSDFQVLNPCQPIKSEDRTFSLNTEFQALSETWRLHNFKHDL